LKALVVVESPSKAKTIEKYLGKGYTVKASKGHVVDLPKSGLAVDVDHDFKPEYTVMPSKKKVITALKKELKGKDKLIIAVDPDREGEAIGWHVANKLGLVDLKGKKKKKEIELERIVFTEITKTAVQGALENPRELDIDLLNAQQARRILDRLVGYKLSPLLWKKIRYGLSAGRVQSVAIKFIVDREREREKFKADEYWKILAYLSEGNAKAKKTIVKTDDETPEAADSDITFELSKIDNEKLDIDKEKLAEAVLDKIISQAWKISKIDKRETKRNPKPPFTTSTMQQTAANWFGFSAKKTMTLAQKLYEAGLITYMRTDSTNMAKSAVDKARKYIGDNYKQALPEKPNFYKTKAKVAQEAHESIRPANFSKAPGSVKLEKDQARLYELIWQRALASQMTPAKLESMTLIILHEVDGKTYEFRANGQRVVEKGYLQVYPEKVSENVLPKLEKGDELNLSHLLATQHFTQPPPRYSEATLVKELEKYGIGRPSTYAPIISTIQQRKYVEKEGKYFFPTDTGRVVVRLLEAHFDEIVDKDFTAHMEDHLDNIANGEEDWKKVLEEFYGPFSKKLTKKDKEINRDDFTVLGDAPKDIKCPECGGKMVIKLGKNGRFYSCVKFPDCKGMRGIDGKTEEDVQKEAHSKEFLQMYEPAPKTDDGRDYLLKQGKYGRFWAHPDYPKVKDAQPLQLRPEKIKELYGDPPQTDDDRDFVFKTGKYGKFWAHPDYPKVKKTVRIKEKS
jgi:DNA topoisomerase-1